MSDDQLIDLANAVRTKKDFLVFLQELQKTCNARNDAWENDNLRAYLNGLHGYANDTADTVVADKEGDELLSWRRLAEMLLAARVYE